MFYFVGSSVMSNRNYKTVKSISKVKLRQKENNLDIVSLFFFR